MEKKELLKSIVDKINDKKFKIYIYAPNLTEASNIYSMGVVQLYTHCKLLRDSGYDAYILKEEEQNKRYVTPEYLDEELKSLPSISAIETPINIGPEDFLIVPEYFTNVMNEIYNSNIPCEKIVFCQSEYYMLDSLMISGSWSQFGFKNVITTSPELAKHINSLFYNLYDIKNYTIGIPDYFQSNEDKRLVIGFYSRFEKDITRFIKTFYLKHPHLRFIGFEPINGSGMAVEREVFAKKLSKLPAIVWLDSETGFGTIPLEAFKSGSILVGFQPKITKEYVKDGSAVWSNDINDLAEQLGQVLNAWLENSPELVSVYEKMKEISNSFTIERQNQELKSSYEYFFNKRKEAINNLINTEE